MSRIQGFFRTSEVDPESRNRVLLIGGLTVVVLVALGLIVYGYYIDRIQPNNETVITVGDHKFSYSYLLDRVDAGIAEGTFDSSNANFSASLATLASNIQNEELVRLIAEQEGVTLTNDELEQAMRNDLGLNPDATRLTYANALQSHLQVIGLSLGQYEQIIGTQALQKKMEDQIQAGLPAKMEQVELNLIQTGTDAEAASAHQRIVAGEDFGEVAKSVSKDSSASNGGAVGWVPRDLLNPKLADVAFSIDTGKVSDVIETDKSYYVIRVDGKETRALDQSTQAQLAQSEFGKKLETASNTFPMQNLITVGVAQRIATHVQQATGG